MLETWRWWWDTDDLRQHGRNCYRSEEKGEAGEGNMLVRGSLSRVGEVM